MSNFRALNDTASEELTLQAKGYKIIKKLGEGSYANVYLADYRRQSNQHSTSMLACKIVDTRKAPKDFTKKFLPRELDVLVRLSHPHIIHVHSVFRRKQKYFIFMRYAEQGDLLEYVSKHGPISEPQARVWFRQMSLAMQYLHDQNIVHRDLKCENILITNNFNAKIADFGFSRFVVDDKGKPVQSETYCGSLSYAAPEVLHGTPYNPKVADVWSLGIILYVMLNKAMPFDDTNARRLYEQQLAKRWKFRSKVVDMLSDNAKKLVPMMLDPDSKKRFNMEQVLSSEWIAMDPRLINLTDDEKAAKIQALEGKKYHRSKIQQKSETTRSKTDKYTLSKEDLKVLKEASKTAIRLSVAMKPETLEFKP